MDKRRLFVVLMATIAIFAMLLGRIFWIQTVEATAYSHRQVDLLRNSVLQREQRLELDSGRGQYVDRNGVALTGDSYLSLLVFPIQPEDAAGGRVPERLLQTLKVNRSVWEAYRSKMTIPEFWKDPSTGQPIRLTEEAERLVEELGSHGLAAVRYVRRYTPPYPSSQLIGYIGQDPSRIAKDFAIPLAQGRMKLDTRIGAAGLEKTFQPLISGIGGTSISLFTDSLSRPLPGLGYRLISPNNPYYPLKVVTTLDAGIQKRLEQLADRAGLQDGAIVVLDAADADVVAMVSRPSFDPNDVDMSRGGWSNRALSAAIPGSVFKTVVAAAALEAGVVAHDEIFECKGALGKFHFTCWKKEGHGRLTFREAFAESCNIVFGQVMTRLSADQLKKAAEELGVLSPVGWTGKVLQHADFTQLDQEDGGVIFAPGADVQDEGLLMQTGIGQRDVRLTPLQAANLIVTLLNAGEAKQVRAVKEIRYRTDRLLVAFPNQNLDSGVRAISGKTSIQLLAWMKDVVRDGTGQLLQQAKWTLAGKSGTAQVPVGGGERINQWFIGYGPVEQPRYAVAVVSLKQKASGNQATLLFRDVMNALAEEELKRAAGGG